VRRLLRPIRARQAGYADITQESLHLSGPPPESLMRL
jgi:hypothetical protein